MKKMCGYGHPDPPMTFICIKCSNHFHATTNEIFCDGCKAFLERRATEKRSTGDGRT